MRQMRISTNLVSSVVLKPKIQSDLFDIQDNAKHKLCSCVQCFWHDETWVVEMRIWYIKIGNELVLHVYEFVLWPFLSSYMYLYFKG
jgi:hypothetical protein